MEQMNIASDIGLEEVKKIASNQLWDAYGCSGIGGRTENQDSYSGVWVEDCVAVTVCDGMGGMNGGQTASSIAKTQIINHLMGMPVEKWKEDSAKEAVVTANDAIYQTALSSPQLRGMGTTATLLMITPEAAFITHIGDSRIYQLRNGKKIFRTFDHSKVFEMVAQNIMTEEQARLSSFSNIITRAMGIRPDVEPVVVKLPYRKGDRFVLCSDGIWNCVPESQMLMWFCEQKTAAKEVRVLAETVNGHGFRNGGEHDNLTVIVVDVKTDSEFQYGLGKTIADGFCHFWSKFKRDKSKLQEQLGKKN